MKSTEYRFGLSREPGGQILHQKFIFSTLYRVINVPIPDDNIAKTVNTLPRTESNSGMVNIKLKRKMCMKNYHKFGMINPTRIYECLKYLIKKHPAYKGIKIENERTKVTALRNSILNPLYLTVLSVYHHKL